ncbi:hypothetical protein NLU13_6806 [Sarocladium strictum]|uniref:Zn(2)-C6 fungal-type domain-containing protein n=1 Tax=Sarocladium strictum TaxID=5046 RepID=A0AA39GFK0_SARSR|nr:hypothetical protein NLU13_6806 [Sarocladium strictum]
MPSKPRSTVCLRCASIKQGCTGGFPCERCVRLGVPCQPKSATSPASPDQDAGLYHQPKPKARIRRVHTGCVTCKKRKKKCDETKPSCGNCRRLCLTCEWSVDRLSNYQAAESLVDMVCNSGWPQEQWYLDMGVNDGLVEEEQEQQQRQRQQLRASQELSTSAPSADEGLLDAGMADLLCHLAGVQGPLPVDASASSTLDDISWSLSPDANARWLDALPQSQSPPSVLSTSSASATATESLSLTLHRPSLMPDMTSPLDKALLNHYSTVVSSVLARCANPASNPYSAHLLPMAMANPIVLHSILALSATHWQRIQPQMEDRAALHRGKAAQSLAQLLPHIDSSTIDIALVSCLLLCMTELFDGSSTGWTLHLQGAKRLFAALREKKRAGSHVRFLVKLARFLDSAATTSTCKPPLIEKQQVIAACDFEEDAPPSEDAAIYGIPKELFHLVDRVNDLASKRGTRVDEASENAFRKQAAAIRDQLDNWALDFGGLAGAVTSLGGGSQAPGDDVLHATTAYEAALRLRLHQVTEGYSLADAKVSEWVGRIIEAVQRIRYGSPLETCLLFPLVMAGGACEKLEDRIVIHDRLIVMEKTCGFGYIHQSRELVEKVWRRREEAGETRVNWARVRYEEMGGLAVF